MSSILIQKAFDASPLFEGIPPSDRADLLTIAFQRMLPKNSPLFHEGDEAAGFYMVVTGKVRVFKVSSEGKEHILHIFGPGEPVGEVAVFAGKHFPAFASTLEDCRLLYFPRNRFLDLASRKPQILLNMLATLSLRLRRFTQKIESLSLKEVAARLAGVLLELPADANAPGAVRLPATKSHLASEIGTTPETLSRTFQKMSRQGLIRVERNRIQLLDRQALASLAAGEIRS
ncbi:MAG: Crp/Fnr family transcriptional regulator [bacterium]